MEVREMANKKRSSFAELAEQFIKNTDPREARRAARKHLRQMRKGICLNCGSSVAKPFDVARCKNCYED
jgi:hypothetical protein